MNKNQDRGFGDFSNIEFVNGDAIKRARFSEVVEFSPTAESLPTEASLPPDAFSLTPEAEMAFELFSDYLSRTENIHLQKHFPKTKVVHDKEEGAYYVQDEVQTRTGRTNLASLPEPSRFDWDQIRSLDDLAVLLNMMQLNLRFSRSTMYDPRSGLEPGVGWFLEMHRPDTFALGRQPGDDCEAIYCIDRGPLPVTEQGAMIAADHFYDAMDEIARTKFGTGLEDFVSILH